MTRLRLARWFVVAGALLVALDARDVARAQSKTTIDVLYPYASLFKSLHEELAKRFHAENPNIEIRYRAPAENYEDATQQMLRAAVAGNMPDVAYHGLNRVRIFVEARSPCRSIPSSRASRTGARGVIERNWASWAKSTAGSMACPLRSRLRSSTATPTW